MRQNAWFTLAAVAVLAAHAPVAGQTASAPAQQSADAQTAAAAAQKQTDAGQQPSEARPAPEPGDAKVQSTPGGKALGMSILGNQEAPTSLVIVPWKGSELGGSPGISLMLDDSRQPVDKDVFMRSLRYYEIRAETTRHDGATAGGRENTAAGSGATQSTATRGR